MSDCADGRVHVFECLADIKTPAGENAMAPRNLAQSMLGSSMKAGLRHEGENAGPARYCR